LLISKNGFAQTKFIKFKKYLISISFGIDTLSPQYIGVSVTQRNVIYIEDVSRHPQDLNGLLELPIVWGLSEHFQSQTMR
jgi:hypothetical protein